MRYLRPWTYVLVGLVLLALALSGSRAWATPEQAPDGQGTVPTARPPATAKPPTPIVIVKPPSDNPSTVPATDAPPMPTAEPTAAAAATDLPPAPSPTLAPPPGLGLAVTADRLLGWPGANLQFTATLTNYGPTALDQVTLDIYLADGLAALPQAAGAAGVWSGQTLHVAAAGLAAGQQISVPFGVTVLRTVQAGSVLQVMGIGRAAGGRQAVVQTLIPLPPAELPTTGGNPAF